jgi:drug/metabolite transporter (DMT)-like permease
MFTALFAYYTLKEKISPYDWGAIGLMLVGILVIENPFAHSTTSEEKSGALEAVGAISALVGAVLVGQAMMQMRRVG